MILSTQTITVPAQAIEFDMEAGAYVSLRFEVNIDTAMLCSLARKATRNKSGKTVLGPLTLRIVGRERVTP